jgi:exodeoxyribonuclease V alpha subunit
VILTQNMYEKSVFNGDIGKIIQVIPLQKKIIVEFMSEMAEFSSGELKYISLAFAISIHKSQGSQFPIVIMPFHSSQGFMLFRSLVYTGITRTQRVFIGVGDFNALKRAAAFDNSIFRKTTLLGHLNESNLRIDNKSTLILR